MNSPVMILFKKRCLLGVLLFYTGLNSSPAQGTLKGGWVEYRHIVDRPWAKTSLYAVTFHVYGSGTASAAGSGLKIYNAVNGESLEHLIPEDSFVDTLTLENTFSTCSNAGTYNNRYKTYRVYYTLELPMGAEGYLLAFSARGRDKSVVNISGPEYSGILLTATINGTINGVDNHTNSSPVFKFTDTVTVCRNTPFTYPVEVKDQDGDSISFRFGEAIDAPFDTTAPPLFPLAYVPPFSGMEPMGNSVNIDPVTGTISGTAPDLPGSYVIAIYAEEWRNGKLLNTVRKESQIKVTSCPFVKPLLKPVYSSCRNYTFNFKNEITCPEITSWFWDFGVTNATTDTSTLSTPGFAYPSVPGTYTIQLKVANKNGYIDSATSIVKIYDSINVSIQQDTAVCKTDSITLRPVTDADNFIWRETGGGNTLNNYNIKNPKASPLNDTTTYFVTAQLDGCTDSTSITIYASPYPSVQAGRDTVICKGEKIDLKASAMGNIFTWSPVNSLLNSHTLEPIAYPSSTTAYILSVRDTFYCPVILKDTVVVKVVPGFRVDAGKDDAVVFGQQYQFNAKAIGNTEIVTYTWQPASYFLNPKVPDAITIINTNVVGNMPFTVTATTEVGNCSASDEVVLKVYSIPPSIILPNAFTPNNDGKNDVLKPILVGMGTLDYFTVYNRYGQIVYTTSEKNKGWDGNWKGVKQPGDVYAVMVKGKDYNGKSIFKKASVVLVR